MTGTTDLRQGVTEAGHDVLDIVDDRRDGFSIKEFATERGMFIALKGIAEATAAPPKSEKQRELLVAAAAGLVLAIEQIDAAAPKGEDL